jgi:MazG family protein
MPEQPDFSPAVSLRQSDDQSTDDETDSLRRGARDGVQELIDLGELVKTLRAQCPWDRRQTHSSLAPHLLEEAYEAIDAIEALIRPEPADASDNVASADASLRVEHLKEELGDVLFQVFFHSELASEEGYFTLADVARAIHEKLVSRHPHVFGEASAETAEDVAARWEVLKKSEKARLGLADSIPAAMPAQALATKLLKKADSLGIDLPSSKERVAQVEVALKRLQTENSEGVTDAAPETVAMVGEALLAFADLARRVRVDPEMALRAATRQLRQQVE